METAPTTHETRARAAKAQALATVLEAAGASAADLFTEKFAVGAEAWVKAAQAATLRCLLGVDANGNAVTVHPPHSDATVRAVAHILELRAARFAPARRPRDSQGYRSTLARIAPLPETTEADLFSGFRTADR